MVCTSCRFSIVPAIGLLALGFALAPLRSQGPPPPEVTQQDATPYQAALHHYKSGNYEAARTEIEAAEKANPGDVATETLKARILIEQGDFDAGEKLLRSLLTPTGPPEVQMVLGDLLLRKHDFNGAAKQYTFCLQAKPGDPALTLKVVYALIGANDLPEAEKTASKLKPLDPDYPSYYFARAALAQTTGNAAEAEEDIQTARTIYGITVTNRYLKTYLEVFAKPAKASTATSSSATTNAAPSGVKSQP